MPLLLLLACCASGLTRAPRACVVVWGMIPKERLGRILYTHLKCYKGAEHPHSAQQPIDITHLIGEKCMP